MCVGRTMYSLCARINFHLSILISLKRTRLKYLLSSWGAVLLLQHSKLGHRPALHPAPAQPHKGEMSASIVTVARRGKPVPGIAMDSNKESRRADHSDCRLCCSCLGGKDITKRKIVLLTPTFELFLCSLRRAILKG